MIVNARFLTQPTTGVQRYGQELSRLIKALRPDTRFVSPRNVLHSGIAGELNVEKVGTATGHVWEQVALPRFLKKYADGELLLSLGNTGPVRYDNQIAVIHDLSVFRHPESYSRKFGLLYRTILPRLVRTCRAIVTDSAFSRDELVSEFGCESDAVFVVPCGVGSQFRPDRTDSPEKPYILAVSSLAPHKNLQRLLDAFEMAGLRGVTLKVVGAGGSVFAHTSARGREMSDVTFLGHVPEEQLVDLYRNASLFVYPSLYEGFGLPPLEAMACGCPCLVSDAASLPEVCGDAAIYCDPASTESIAGGMTRLLNDTLLRSDCRQRGLMRAASFSWEASARRLLDVIDSVAAEHSARRAESLSL